MFYETGYAHALGKQVVLLTRNADDIPFDLKHYPHIVYGGRVVDLIPELEKRVKWLIEHPHSSPQDRAAVHFRVNGVPVLNTPSIEYALGQGATGCRLDVDVHNPAEREIRVLRFELGVITAPEMEECYHCPGAVKGEKWRSIVLPEGRRLHLGSDLVVSVLPGGWETFELVLRVAPGHEALKPKTEQEVILRAFTGSGYTDHAFLLKFVSKS